MEDEGEPEAAIQGPDRAPRTHRPIGSRYCSSNISRSFTEALTASWALATAEVADAAAYAKCASRKKARWGARPARSGSNPAAAAPGTSRPPSGSAAVVREQQTSTWIQMEIIHAPGV